MPVELYLNLSQSPKKFPILLVLNLFYLYVERRAASASLCFIHMITILLILPKTLESHRLTPAILSNFCNFSFTLCVIILSNKALYFLFLSCFFPCQNFWSLTPSFNEQQSSTLRRSPLPHSLTFTYFAWAIRLSWIACIDESINGDAIVSERKCISDRHFRQNRRSQREIKGPAWIKRMKRLEQLLIRH